MNRGQQRIKPPEFRDKSGFLALAKPDLRRTVILGRPTAV
jgi:hypothetical protein